MEARIKTGVEKAKQQGRFKKDRGVGIHPSRRIETQHFYP
jgi:hypothetical protein